MTAVLTITASARGITAGAISAGGRPLAVMLAAVLGLVAVTISSRRRGRRIVGAPVLACLLALSCGGGPGAAVTPKSTATVPGTYPVQVAAAATSGGSVSHTTTIGVTVQ